MEQPVPPSVQGAVAELELQAPALIDRVVTRIRAEVPHAAGVPDDDLRANVARLLAGAFRTLARREGPGPAELAAAERVGRERACQGETLADVLRSHRIGVRECWLAFEDVASRREIGMETRMRFSQALWEWADGIIDATMTGHRAAELAGDGPHRPHPVTGLATVRLEDREAFVTADGSTIRELAGIPAGNAVGQSLAEATVPPGRDTIEHYHRRSEEIYHFTAGAGRMRLGDEEAPVRAGDTVVIPPGTRHKLWNTGDEPLVLLCCCAPPYSHDDTVLLEQPG